MGQPIEAEILLESLAARFLDWAIAYGGENVIL
jgi:hypothetical protein